MAVITKSITQTLVMWQTNLPELTPALNSYGTLSKANRYFDTHLRALAWKKANNWKRKAALTEATGIIDRLNYEGVADGEDHAFPRDNEAIPLAVEIATYEIALQLIQGVDPNIEISGLSVTSRTFQSVKTTYDRSYIPIYMRVGIPSARAWDLLKPYLADISGIALKRIN